MSVIPSTEDVSISFLPLAHMFERVVQVKAFMISAYLYLTAQHQSVQLLFVCFLQTVMYSSGARVGFFQGDIRLLPDDMKALQPTIFPVVPRLLNRVYDKVGGCHNPSPFHCFKTYFLYWTTLFF